MRTGGGFHSGEPTRVSAGATDRAAHGTGPTCTDLTHRPGETTKWARALSWAIKHSQSVPGYATKRDLSLWTRLLFWALLALIAFGIVGIFVAIPSYDITYPVLDLVIFGGFTVIDFNRLRRADSASAVTIAAGIFLDIFNAFLALLELFGGGRDERLPSVRAACCERPRQRHDQGPRRRLR